MNSRFALSIGRVPKRSFWETFFPKRIGINAQEAGNHVHVLGTSNSGKSRWLASYYLGLIEAGIGVTLIDPHGDLTRLVLGTIAERYGTQMLEKTIYLDVKRAADRSRYLPFNVLKQPGSRTQVALNVLEAFHRAWPSLAGGVAPRFDKLVLNGTKALIAQNARLPDLSWFLTDQTFRNEVLSRETDERVLRHWHNWYDKLPARLQSEYADSTLSRVDLLAFDEILRYSLGSETLALDFRSIMDSGTNVLLNLAGLPNETQRLIGSLFTVMYEQAALSREDTTTRRTHVLMIDEFARFSSKSEEAMQTMLSQTRKYGLFLVMAHQNWTQASNRLKGAMGNARLKVAFQLDRPDAEYTALSFTKVDPRTVSTREDQSVVSVSGRDQVEAITQTLQNLPPRHALVKLPDLSVHHIVTDDVPDVDVDTSAIEREQMERYFKTPEIELPKPAKLPRLTRLSRD